MLSDDQNDQPGELPTAGTIAPALDGMASADPAAATVAAEPGFLLFRCGGVDCAVPLVALREVLPRCPAALPLPHSPEWLLGVFALRAELVGLADPAPLLFSTTNDSTPLPHGAALLAGVGERALAWAVESIGATAPLTWMDGDEGDGGASSASDPSDLPGSTMAAPYAAGVIAPESGRRYTVIDVEALLADMLRALVERPAEP